MRYTEDFKKQVVKKVLSQGVVLAEVSRKLNVSDAAIHRWKQQYRDEVQSQVPRVDVESLLYEPPVDVEELLARADVQEVQQASGSAALGQHVRELLSQGKSAESFTEADRYAIVMTLRALPSEHYGEWLRKLGLQRSHIRLWEEQLISMSKKTISNDQYTKQLEDEVRRLKKQLGEAERDNKELKILIELKKKYPTLFHQDEDKS